VNAGLKEHWGRARPREVMEFGGSQQFTPALLPTAQCETNCSFVSGHAALGFYLIGIAWVSRKRRWLVAGITLGGLVGAGRILQGGHFLGDVIFSFWVVYFSAVLLDRLCNLPQQAPEPLGEYE
jgi:lipid A 4'-phosphatase